MFVLTFSSCNKQYVIYVYDNAIVNLYPTFLDLIYIICTACLDSCCIPRAFHERQSAGNDNEPFLIHTKVLRRPCDMCVWKETRAIHCYYPLSLCPGRIVAWAYWGAIRPGRCRRKWTVSEQLFVYCSPNEKVPLGLSYRCKHNVNKHHLADSGAYILVKIRLYKHENIIHESYICT